MPSNGLHILVTNDDGVQAPGLLALKNGLLDLGEVTVLAPLRNWSASGHVKTMHKPLRVEEVMLADGTAALATDGAPSDAVALAFLGIVERKIDLVVAGINRGPNLGHDLTYSGTVTAAMEGTLSGAPSIAFSLASYSLEDFSAAAGFAERLVCTTWQHGLPANTLLNVNIPALPADEIKGVLVTRTGDRIYRDELIRRTDPRGTPYYWIGGPPPEGREDQGTDIWAVANGYISVTPIQLDLTAHSFLPTVEGWELTLDQD